MGTETGRRIASIVHDRETDLHVPALCDVEVLAGLRRATLRYSLDVDRAGEILEDYQDLPITRHGHLALLSRMFDLRRNFSVYDAAYIALAERTSGAFLTSDARLGRAARTHTEVTVLP
jgi:predicted nucleic acid-binding protein